ncbi:hypothetical protein F5148DRAFT_816372 [Russula earlei]|uniref:Uncharacterized protein n=1 Tax=Russula earlei TaxID=71964 RepID=A0ACC0UBF6_9AGAM|nr:hypothetical protein F5148DRAFT_816372 [Russula earlei]
MYSTTPGQGNGGGNATAGDNASTGSGQHSHPPYRKPDVDEESSEGSDDENHPDIIAMNEAMNRYKPRGEPSAPARGPRRSLPPPQPPKSSGTDASKSRPAALTSMATTTAHGMKEATLMWFDHNGESLQAMPYRIHVPMPFLCTMQIRLWSVVKSFVNNISRTSGILAANNRTPEQTVMVTRHMYATRLTRPPSRPTSRRGTTYPQTPAPHQHRGLAPRNSRRPYAYSISN